MQQSEFNALKELITAAALIPSLASFVIGMAVLLFIARIVNNSTKPVFALVGATNENFDKVLTNSQQATARYEERVQKHEEASNRFLEVMEGYRASFDSHTKASEANTAVLVELKNEIHAQRQLDSERQKDMINFFGGLVNGVKQDIAVHDKHATERYAQIDAQLKAIQTEIHTVLKDIDKEIKTLSMKPAPTIDFSPMTTRLDAITKAIESMAAQFAGRVMTPAAHSETDG